MTITGAEEAYEAKRSHHRVLSEQLSVRAAAVSEAVAAGRPHEAAVLDVLAYLAEEVLPHAAAEEGTIYPAAAAHDGLTGTVNEMLAEHHTLSQAADALAGLSDGRTAAEQARQVAELFAAHADRENDVLFPALLADDSVDLPALLAQMHRRAAA
ncbi:MAG: hemerythrin domain-containing protein, partial [Streptosporangiaceae bacterium]